MLQRRWRCFYVEAARPIRMTASDTARLQPSVEQQTSLSDRDLLCAIALAALTVASRVLNRGALYFVDGPRIVYSILTKTYVVQSPGYWALAHLGGLFHDPAAGLAFWNITFSALGVSVFYLLCRMKQGRRLVCFFAALAYGSVYFVWFAGEIHSSYASQILFPPLSLFCFFRFKARNSAWWAMAWALSAAVGMALRPSDGVFLLPLWLYLLLRYVPQLRIWTIFTLVNGVVFLGWYIPTRIGLHATGQATTGSTILLSMQTVSPLLTGINGRSLANMSRALLPLLVAFWPLIPSLFAGRNSDDTKLALVWTVPGLCFFLLCYVADPTYMVFLSGAVLWLVVTSFHTPRALVCLLICAAFNTMLFVAATPLRPEGLSHRLANFYVVKYTRYGIQHQWSSTVGDGAKVP